MKERPIIFSAEMVRAILEGRKTQTRRVRGLEDVNNYPGSFVGVASLGALGYRGLCRSDYYLKPSAKKEYQKYPRLYHWLLGVQSRELNPIPVRCPYGQPGDRLWVRETWATTNTCDYLAPKEIWRYEHPPMLYYSAWTGAARESKNRGKWRSPIHMPRWASRITLEIKSVRVERVQEISEEDAIAEGISGGDWLGNPVGEYRKLWDSINAKRGYPWESNSWVWAIEFEQKGRG
jgi:hypothetical protein